MPSPAGLEACRHRWGATDHLAVGGAFVARSRGERTLAPSASQPVGLARHGVHRIRGPLAERTGVRSRGERATFGRRHLGRLGRRPPLRGRPRERSAKPIDADLADSHSSVTRTLGCVPHWRSWRSYLRPPQPPTFSRPRSGIGHSQGRPSRGRAVTAPTRRTFLAASALTAASYARVRGANDRIGLGVIGYGLMGKGHVATFRQFDDVALVAVSDVHRGRLEEGRKAAGGDSAGLSDFRKLIDDNRVDAVVIATPDHWHALMAMMACAAGKDVYVEKPLTLFAREGRWLIDVARKHKRVIQVGTQQRSGEHYRRARELIRGGHIGKVVSVRLSAVRNVLPGFGNPPDQDPPADLDWDRWLGPAPPRKYNPNRGLYHFRWFWDTAGGQMTNLGTHHLDIVDWVLGLDSLKRSRRLAGGSR